MADDAFEHTHEAMMLKLRAEIAELQSDKRQMAQIIDRLRVELTAALKAAREALK